MRQFLGLVMYMGLVQQPSYAHYWRRDEMFVTFANKIMSRNRFQLILSCFHCADNQHADTSNRLYKIETLVKTVVDNFQKWYIPEEDLCIDEIVVLFLGRLVFGQFIKNKKHRYGIKIDKLCAKDHYTLDYKIYAGHDRSAEGPVAVKVVMEFMEPYMNCGRTLFTDSWYTSTQLAEKLIEKNTHLVGTLRSNRKGNPKDVVSKKLKK